jgi:hypothetical protein
MHAPHGSRGYHQIPGGLQNPPRAQRLPERDIELASRRMAAHQSSHDQALTHNLYYPTSFLPGGDGFRLSPHMRRIRPLPEPLQPHRPLREHRADLQLAAHGFDEPRQSAEIRARRSHATNYQLTVEDFR